MFYVYYLHAADSGELLYIGRSDKPVKRQAAFHKLHHVFTVLGVCQKHSSFENACAAELAAIQKHRPPYNKYIVSSVGAFGHRHSVEALEKIAQVARKPKTSATRQAMRKPKSEKHKEAMRKPKGPEHQAKLAEHLKVARLCRKAVINFKGH